MKLFIAGHNGMVGSALVRRFSSETDIQLILRSRTELDLLDQRAVKDFIKSTSPDAAIIGAAKVGGIHANSTYPADFIYENLAIATNCVDGAFRGGVQRVLFLGSSCIYPKHAPQPMAESSLLTGPLEPTNEAYAVAKIAGLKLCEYYRKQYGVLYHSVMPTNMYGPRDNYHLEHSHVVAALIRKFHEAKASAVPQVVAWGTGSPRREFLHVDDLADACAFILRQDNPPDLINIGTGTDVTIKELTELVATVTGFSGSILWDHSKPDGTPRKLMDVSRLAMLGWRAKIDLKEGVKRTYDSYLSEKAAGLLRT